MIDPFCSAIVIEVLWNRYLARFVNLSCRARLSLCCAQDNRNKGPNSEAIPKLEDLPNSEATDATSESSDIQQESSDQAAEPKVSSTSSQNGKSGQITFGSIFGPNSDSKQASWWVISIY